MSVFGVNMGIVTALEFNTDRNKAHLYVDGVYALTVSIDLALENKLETGMSVDDEYLELLKKPVVSSAVTMQPTVCLPTGRAVNRKSESA